MSTTLVGGKTVNFRLCHFVDVLVYAAYIACVVPHIQI